MAEKESWDDEMDGFAKDEADQHTSGEDSPDPAAVTKPAQAAGASAEEVAADDKQTSDGDLGAAKSEASQDINASRARKAQRTRRAKIVVAAVPGGVSTPTHTGHGSSVNTTGQPPQARVACRPEENVLGKRGKAAANHPSSPIPVPPQVLAYQNEEGAANEEFVYEEPSKILAGLCCMAEGVLNAFRGAWHLIKGLLQAVAKVIFFPALCGVLMYVAAVYMVGTYLTNTADTTHLKGFAASLKYILGHAPWSALPIFAAFLVVNFDTHGRHHQFLYESIIDSSLLVLNCLVMTSHANPDCLVWLGPVMIVSSMFRMVYWLSLFYLGPRWKTIFKTPAFTNCLVFNVYNLGVSIHQYIGRLFDDDPGSAGSQAQETTTQTGTSGQA